MAILRPSSFILLSCAVSPTTLAFAINNARIAPAPLPPPVAVSVATEKAGSARNGALRRPPSTIRAPCRMMMAAHDDEYDYEELFASPAERSRIRRRKVMTHQDWLRHRSSDRFFRNLGNIGESAIFLNLLDEVSAIIALCIFVILWNEMLFDGYVDFSGVHHDPLLHVVPLGGSLLLGRLGPVSVLPAMKLPTLPFTLSSGALGLLLVFRTNASYGRFSEGRETWGTIVERSRSILVLGSVWIRDDAGGEGGDVTEEDRTVRAEESLRRLGVSTWALARSIRNHISGEWDPDDRYFDDIRKEMKEFPDQAEELLSARHRPLRALYDLQKVVWDLDLDGDQKAQLAQHVTSVGDACGACERIYSTPLPLSYTRHTARFLTLWMLLLPLGMYDALDMSWNHFTMIPAVAVLSLLLFGIEEIAVSLEEPFSILPLDKLVDDSRLAASDVQLWGHVEDKKADDDARLRRTVFRDGHSE